MKKIFVLLILLSACMQAFSQSISASNVKVVKLDKGNVSSEDLDEAGIRCYYKFVQPVTISQKTEQKIDTLTLDIGAKVSHYYDATRARRDSIFGDFMNNKLNPATIQSISVVKNGDMSSFDSNVGTTFESEEKGETAHLYKKKQVGDIIIIDRSEDAPNKYKCIDKVSFQWDIKTDTLTILGYLCQKASTTFRGRTYDAWFTSDIPVNDGPWKFYGLPGLILKVNDTENIFSFEIIGLEHLTPTVEILLAKEDYINASLKDLDKLKKKRSGGMAVNVNGGNVIMVRKKNNNEYISLEKE